MKFAKLIQAATANKAKINRVYQWVFWFSKL